MSSPPQITDRAALLRHRSRATDAALFLHENARDEAQDRVMMVNKRFTAPAVITPFRRLWQSWRTDARLIADTPTLDLVENSHDLIVHSLCLHWADDPVGQLIQCRRALKADGLLIVTTLGGKTLGELRAALAEAEVEVSGGLSPRVMPMADIRDLGGLMQRAGFALPVADSLPLTVTYESALHLMRDLRAMGETNALQGRIREMTKRSVLLRAAEIYAASFEAEEGRVYASFETITLTGWAPDANQPKPLRPGSASHRLSEALGTTETPLKD